MLGMSLAETMIATMVFSLAICGLIYAQIFAMRMDGLTNSKLGASDEARRGFMQMTDEIRAARMWIMGNGSSSSFTRINNGTLQRGTALQIYPTTEPTVYTRYYFDTANKRLCRSTNGSTSYEIIADHLTGTNLYFQAENYAGEVKSDLSYKYVIAVKMEFAQFQYPMTKVGGGNYYDYYKMEFRVTPHCPNGE